MRWKPCTYIDDGWCSVALNARWGIDFRFRAQRKRRVIAVRRRRRHMSSTRHHQRSTHCTAVSLPLLGRCPIIGSLPLSPKSFFLPADNLPAKIRSARQQPGRDGFLVVNCPPGTVFFGGGHPIMVRLFMRAVDILIRERHIKFFNIFPRAVLSWGRHFNVAPALRAPIPSTSTTTTYINIFTVNYPSPSADDAHNTFSWQQATKYYLAVAYRHIFCA